MSKLILLLAGIFSVVVAFWDARYLHGHRSDVKIADNVEERFRQEAHFLADNTPIEVTAEKHRVRLAGKVVTEAEKRELGSLALDIPGVWAVENDLEVLNEDALRKVQQAFNAEPIGVPVDYTRVPRGKVRLGGPVEDAEVQAQLVEAFGAVSGVQGVEEDWSEPVTAEQVEAQLADIMRLYNIYFDFNLATIRQESMQTVDLVAEVLAENKGFRVRVEGHTDSVGSEAYNLKLSQRRSESVVRALVERGIDGARLEAMGYGESRPIARNDTPEQRAENRRIEFRVLD